MSAPSAGPRLSTEPVTEVGKRLTTAAGLAGLLFAVLFIGSFAFLRVGVPPSDGAAFADWWEANRQRVAVGTYLIPFTGIAFLWFVAAVRQRIGRLEGLFFSTIFLGSALLLVATVFVTGAASGATIAAADSLDTRRAAEVAAFSHAFAYALFFGFTVKMGAMFMLVVASIGRGTTVLPRWLVLLTTLLGIALLLVVGIWEITALVFPVWVAVVSLMIIRASLEREQSG